MTTTISYEDDGTTTLTHYVTPVSTAPYVWTSYRHACTISYLVKQPEDLDRIFEIQRDGGHAHGLEPFERTTDGGTLTTTSLGSGDAPTPTTRFDCHKRFDYHSAVAHTPFASPWACQKHMTDFNKTLCKFDKCMMSFYTPLVITSTMRMISFDYCAGDSSVKYLGDQPLTAIYEATGPHWGFSTTETSTTTTTSGAPATTSHTTRRCWDRNSCCDQCHYKATHTWWGDHATILWGIGGALGGLALLALLTLCCCTVLNRHNLKKRAVNVKQTVPPAIVPAGRPEAWSSSPGSAITVPVTPTVIPGSNSSGSDLSGSPVIVEKGTLGRQAEEGRGRVQFAEDPVITSPAGSEAKPAIPSGTKPGSIAESRPSSIAETKPGTETKASPAQKIETIVTSPTEEVTSVPAAETQQVEAVPVHQMDGAGGFRTGNNYAAEAGSVRGRKRSRMDGKSV